MLIENGITERALAAERLKRFAILEEHQAAFARISDLLHEDAHDLAAVFIEHFFAATDFHVDAEAHASQVEKTAQYIRGKFTPPIDEAWIARVEKMGDLQFKLGTPTYANLAAISWSHRAAIDLLFDKADDDNEARYLVEQFMRVGALEVEIMVSTVRTLEQRHYRRTLAANAKTFEGSIADIIQSSNRLSAEARAKANGSADAAQALLKLSSEVAAASSQSTTAMADAARMSSGLGKAIATIETDLRVTFDGLAELTETAHRAQESAATLTDNTRSIETILKMIRSIADQAKILSLNALVEAASAGEAGAGFRVVAQEMKDLAGRTEAATGEIGSQLLNIRDTSDNSIVAHRSMRDQFDRLRTIANKMRATLDEQSNDVRQITDNVDETAQGAERSCAAIAEVERGIERVSTGIRDVSQDVTALDENLVGLRATADGFMASLRR